VQDAQMDRESLPSAGGDDRLPLLDRIALWVALLGSLAFAVALFLPAFDCGPRGKAGYGLAMLIYGPVGVLFGDFCWFANPLFVLMLFRLGDSGIGSVFPEWTRRSLRGGWFWLALPVLASVLALAACNSSVPVCDSGAGLSRGPDGLAAGGYVWIGTILFVSIYTFARELASRRDIGQAKR
jgi:hypothetical protein